MHINVEEARQQQPGVRSNSNSSEKEQESLKDEMRNVIDEARMVLPGIQALFGFQTMAVFNQRFEEIADSSKLAYLVALGLLVLAMGLLMAPAAYNRLAERGQVSRKMINLSSRLITTGMIPLLLALTLDVYVVVVAAFDEPQAGVLAALATAILLAGLWFVMPLAIKKAQ
jgi:cobalamin synthase